MTLGLDKGNKRNLLWKSSMGEQRQRKEVSMTESWKRTWLVVDTQTLLVAVSRGEENPLVIFSSLIFDKAARLFVFQYR